MFRSEEHLKTLEEKRDRLADRLSSGQWTGDNTKGLLEYDALEWACRTLRTLLSGSNEQVAEVVKNGNLH